jgi:hypothetical protein
MKFLRLKMKIRSKSMNSYNQILISINLLIVNQGNIWMVSLMKNTFKIFYSEKNSNLHVHFIENADNPARKYIFSILSIHLYLPLRGWQHCPLCDFNLNDSEYNIILLLMIEHCNNSNLMDYHQVEILIFLNCFTSN